MLFIYTYITIISVKNNIKLLPICTLLLYVPLAYLLFFVMGSNFGIGDLPNDNDDIARSIGSLLVLAGVMLIPISYISISKHWKHWRAMCTILHCSVLTGAITIGLYSFIIEGFYGIFSILYAISLILFIGHFIYISTIDDLA